MKTLRLIPAKELFALNEVAPKNDVRYYLTTVCFEHNRTSATNGHVLLSIPTESDAEYVIEYSQYPDGILVSRDSIEQLRKQLKPKQQRESTISLIEIDADTKSYQLVCDGAVVMFTPVDGKFPDIDRVIPDPSACSVSNPITTGFDWDYMALFQKINKALTGNKLASPALLPNKEGNSAARIGFSAPCEDVVGVIMPKRL